MQPCVRRAASKEQIASVCTCLLISVEAALVLLMLYYLGMNVNFDLCEDDGTSVAFFGGASVGMTTGTAVEVAC